MSKIELYCGVEIRISGDAPYIDIEVYNSITGDAVDTYMNPTEARELITMLTAAIAEAEKERS